MKKYIITLIILFLSTSVFAANEIHCGLTPGISNVYCRVIKSSNLYLWDTGTSDYNDNPAWAATDISMTENTNIKGLYYASMPSSAAGRYYFYVYSNATPADTDTVLAAWKDDWDASAFVRLDMIDTVVDTIQAKTDNLPADPADDSDIDAQLLAIDNYIDAEVAAIYDLVNCSGASLCSRLTSIATDTTAIVEDSDELQTDWVNGGRLDLLIDSTLADTGELQTDWVNGGRLDLLIDLILGDTGELQTDWADGGRLDLLLDAVDINDVSIDAIADAVFDELTSGHTSAGSFGKLLIDSNSTIRRPDID